MGCGQSDAKQPSVIVQLGYYSNRGSAQPIRFYAEYLGVQWENKVFTQADWFSKEKPDLILRGHSLANLPYVKEGETIVFESGALPIYLANRENKVNTIARNIEDMIQIAQINGVVEDLKVELIKIFFMMPNEEYLKTGKEAFKSAVTPHLKKLEYTLKGKKYLLGENIVYEDFVVFEISDTVRHYDIDFLRKFPNVKAHNDSIREIPSIKAYMKSPKFQVRPFYNPQIANWC